MSDVKILETPKFTRSIIQDNRTDGYWLETFMADPNDKAAGLIGFGLTTGDISIFDNPVNGGPTNPSGEWKRYVVKTFDSPVAIVLGDCAGNSRQDIVACHDYGETFMNCNPLGGHISWLENPGRNDDGSLSEDWTDRYIGRWPAMHRMKAGYFTQKSILEVVAMSVVRGPQDMESAIPVILFQRPEKSLDALEWKRSIIDDESFTIIHDGAAKKFEGSNGRDTLFVASREGINWLYWEDQEWKQQHITDGMPKQEGKEFYGSACVDVGRVGADPAAYILTIDPYHGTTVTALTKKQTGPDSHDWVRHVLDEYGTPEQLKLGGTGPGHYIVAADFDGDGDEECLVALFGPPPYQGVYYYKAIDIEKGIFAKWKVAEESAARIAVADFSGDGKLDFATIVYNVPHYHEAPDPKVYLYSHDFITQTVKSDPEIISTVWGGEPLVYLPKPTELKKSIVTPLLEVAGYRLALEIIPPHSKITTDNRAAVKVLFGELQDGEITRRALNVPQFEKSSARLVSGMITTEEEGVIFLSFTPTINGPKEWAKIEDVPVKNIFKSTYAQLQLPTDLKFTKVEDLAWGEDFEGIDFWNLSGIDLRFLDKTPLCHVQFWTAAKNVNCGVHNHGDDVFLEVHLSLSTGTNNGGMWRVEPGTEIPADPNTIPSDDFIRLPLATLEQQGGFWERDSYGKPVYNDSGAVVYPYHKWQAGDGGDNLDIWAAIEFNPALNYY